MENDKPKFCKDCRFYSPAPRYPVPFGGSYCNKYVAQCISLEDGSMFLRGVMTPNAVRESTQPGMCGPQGRHFEQKPKWWKFWTREK